MRNPLKSFDEKLEKTVRRLLAKQHHHVKFTMEEAKHEEVHQVTPPITVVTMMKLLGYTLMVLAVQKKIFK